MHMCRDYIYLDVITSSAFPTSFKDTRTFEPLILPDLQHLDVDIDLGANDMNRLFYPKGSKGAKINDEITEAITITEKDISTKQLLPKYVAKFPKTPSKKKGPVEIKKFVVKGEPTITDSSAHDVIRSLRKNEEKLKRIARKF